VDRVAHAVWAMFQKNGTDATTTCVTTARAATGRRIVLVARGSHHGAAPGARRWRPAPPKPTARTSFT
jgi:glutamate-1-semialdehyde 2,1-aminomutase